MLILTFIGTLVWAKARQWITNYVDNGFAAKKGGKGNENRDEGEDEDRTKKNESDISEVEKRIEDKLKEMDAAREELRRLDEEKKEEEKKKKHAQKRAKYEKQVRKKYDLMISVYQKWKNDRHVKIEELERELSKIHWSDEVHSNLSTRLEFVKEAHSYAFGMCLEINSDIHDSSKEINPEKRHAKLTVKIMILLENLQRSREIAESEYGDLTKMVKIFSEALYLCKIQLYFLEVTKGAEQMHDMLSKIKEQLITSSTVTEEILTSWDEFKKIFDEFDSDVDNDGPKLEELGRIVSDQLAHKAQLPQMSMNQQAQGMQPVSAVSPTAAAEVAAQSTSQTGQNAVASPVVAAPAASSAAKESNKKKKK